MRKCKILKKNIYSNFKIFPSSSYIFNRIITHLNPLMNTDLHLKIDRKKKKACTIRSPIGTHSNSMLTSDLSINVIFQDARSENGVGS